MYTKPKIRRKKSKFLGIPGAGETLCQTDSIQQKRVLVWQAGSSVHLSLCWLIWLSKSVYRPKIVVPGAYSTFWHVFIREVRGSRYFFQMDNERRRMSVQSIDMTTNIHVHDMTIALAWTSPQHHLTLHLTMLPGIRYVCVLFWFHWKKIFQ